MTGQSTLKKKMYEENIYYLFLLVSNRYSVAAVCDRVTVARAMLRVH